MEKVFLFVTALCFVITTQVQAVEVTTTRGNLKTDLEAIVGAGNLGTITDLKIIGTLSGTDFTNVSAGLKSSLKTIDLSGVTGFNANALTTLPITNNVGAFQGWTGLTTIVLPEGGVITTIADNAFMNCSNLASVNIPRSITRIGKDVFNGTSKLRTVELPDGLLFLSGFRTFDNSGITAIDIPANTQITGYGVYPDGTMYQTFRGAALSAFKVPDNVVTIRQGAFYNNPLSSITFSSQGNLKYLGGLTDTQLTSLKVPEGVTEIEAWGVARVATLETLELPSTLEKIGDGAFNNCSGLKSITNYSDFPVNLSAAAAAFTGVDKTQCILYVPAGSEEVYREADGWKDFIIKAIGSDAVKQDQTITGLSDITKTVGDADFTLSATASSGLDITYSSSNTSVATISGSTVHIIGAGTTTITASQTGNDSYNAATDVTVTLTVNAATIAIMGVTLNKTTLSLTAGDNETLAATVSPDNATNKAVTWSSSNTAVATVDASGKVTAVAAGNATITVTTTDGSKTATCAVTVAALITYNWLLEPAIAVEGNTAKVVGPGANNFTKFYVNSSETSGNSADLSSVTGEINLKAATADGTGVIKLKINK